MTELLPIVTVKSVTAMFNQKMYSIVKQFTVKCLPISAVCAANNPTIPFHELSDSIDPQFSSGGLRTVYVKFITS
jgi:hypothetical protein